ncbi:MAG: type 1 glutamine amidotransferase domain-containing protein [Candidatus Acidiferrales bacterium]
MSETKLNGVTVAILATNGFEEAELLEPREALDHAGAMTRVIAPKAGKIQGMKHDEKSRAVDADLTLDKADPAEYDALLLPGGALNADQLRMEPKAREFVKSFDRAGKPVAVICHGPWLLVSAGLVKGRTLAAYHTIQDDIRNAGAEWKDEEVVRDKNWVSSRQPSDIPAFNREMLKLFSERKARSASR